MRYDCLYTYAPSQVLNIQAAGERARSLISYCRYLNGTINKTSVSTCQTGSPITFAELRRNNVTTFDLYMWQAPIDLIDQYGADYKHGLFCNCSSAEQFGLYCEYEFPLANDQSQPHRSFEQIIMNQFNSKSLMLTPNELFDNLTCYIGLSQCNALICLDWRQVCNGIIDCAEGEDEKECAQMELHTCAGGSNEYRCQSGHCIPRAFAFDKVYDCLDRSDERLDSIDDFTRK
ncbi:unnamed protein product [Adineta steineri]|nr:unnamed protein product [Adineta steineri]CAF1231090.1 unnamed protein product [Adineta steineri]